MDLTEKLAHITELMVKTKEDWVATKPENTDLAIYLHFWRGDDIVAAVICRLDRDTGLQAGAIGAGGFNADTMSLTFEGYHSEQKENPLTGKDWKPREMQYVAETVPEAKDRGWVNECMTTSIHDRSGNFGFHSKPFQVKGDEVLWHDDQDTLMTKADGGGDGVMFDYLQGVMSGPKMRDIITERAGKDTFLNALMTNLDEEAQLFHTDAATVKALQEKDLAIGVVLSAEPGSEREQWIHERFGETPE